MAHRERERERERAGAPAKYDLIYIDPPYNTEATKSDGNSIANDKENVQATKFVYRDKYSRNGWLNLMNERLKLAKELLKDDGVIFVSIDDAEQAYLKVLMDEIFGEENFVANFVWQKKNEGSADDAKYVKILNEYILFYAKKIENIKTNSKILNIDDGSYKLIDEYVDTRGKYKLKQLDMASLSWSDGLDHVIKHEGKEYYAGGLKENWQERKRGNRAEKDWRWRWSAEKVKWGIKNGFVVFKNDKVYTKQYQFVDNNGNLIKRESKWSNLILDIHGSIGTNEQKNIFDRKVFDHPKPSILINFLINLSQIKKDSRILDFFAGSGTTAHAVLELNKEDGGNRTFTLVTNNENNIGIDVNYERLYRINHGIGTKGESFEWTNKNEPYKSNLNVYNIKYYDISLFNNIDVKEIVKELIKLLKDFGVNSLSEESEKDYTNLLNSLLSLKPQLKENNESN
ncbi:site-specific DNA-methyltransferase [Mycoplasmopsis cynos]|uniref:site-specific DNA-methyltransferase n=1 Tax=Mycoplasmopsis cynos TaxID=171284 RepID=UPI003A5C8391